MTTSSSIAGIWSILEVDVERDENNGRAQPQPRATSVTDSQPLAHPPRPSPLPRPSTPPHPPPSQQRGNDNEDRSLPSGPPTARTTRISTPSPSLPSRAALARSHVSPPSSMVAIAAAAALTLPIQPQPSNRPMLEWDARGQALRMHVSASLEKERNRQRQMQVEAGVNVIDTTAANIAEPAPTTRPSSAPSPSRSTRPFGMTSAVPFTPPSSTLLRRQADVLSLSMRATNPSSLKLRSRLTRRDRLLLGSGAFQSRTQGVGFAEKDRGERGRDGEHAFHQTSEFSSLIDLTSTPFTPSVGAAARRAATTTHPDSTLFASTSTAVPSSALPSFALSPLTESLHGDSTMRSGMMTASTSSPARYRMSKDTALLQHAQDRLTRAMEAAAATHAFARSHATPILRRTTAEAGGGEWSGTESSGLVGTSSSNLSSSSSSNTSDPIHDSHHHRPSTRSNTLAAPFSSPSTSTTSSTLLTLTHLSDSSDEKRKWQA